MSMAIQAGVTSDAWGAIGDLFLGSVQSAGSRQLRNGFSGTRSDALDTQFIDIRSSEPWLPDLWSQFAKALALRDGWDGPRSKAVHRPLVYLVERVLRDSLVEIPNPRLPFVVPSAEGGLQIEWHRSDMELEVYFGPNGEISAAFEDHSGGLEIERRGSEALDLLFRWASRMATGFGDVRHAPPAPAVGPLAIAA
jgi:hypothetical protein